jgi:hypothetical protein
MSYFVGLDVSQKMTAICVVDGRRIWQAQCRCDRRSLAHPPIPSQPDLSGAWSLGGISPCPSSDDLKHIAGFRK